MDWGMSQRDIGDGICDVYYVKIVNLVGENGGCWWLRAWLWLDSTHSDDDSEKAVKYLSERLRGMIFKIHLVKKIEGIDMSLSEEIARF